MPVLSPAGVQEILDLGLYGYALSRFAGVWVGLKTMKDTVEATAVVDGDPHRLRFETPDFTMPEGGLNIRPGDTPVAQEARMIDYKRFAAEAFARANRIDKRVWGQAGAKIGMVAAGKNWLDLSHALSLLRIDEAEAERLGITTYKVAQTWPLDMTSFHEWAEGLDLIIVVEQEDGLVLIPEEGGVVLDLEWVTDQTWRFDREPSLPEGVQVANGTDLPILPFSSDEVGDLVGCDINELPRLVGTGSAVIDGVTMEFTYRLMLVSYKEFAGFQEVRATAHGIPVFERRPVMMILQFESD